MKKYILLLLTIIFIPIRGEALTGKIITTIPAIEFLSSELLKNTGIETSLAVPEGTTVHRLEIDGDLSKEVAKAARSADVLIYMKSGWSGDSSYKWARSGNIAIIPIDCLTPLDGVSHPSVPLDKREGIPMPWLTYPGCISMSEVIARDLSTIYPSCANIIKGNLSSMKRNLKDRDLLWQDKFLSIDNPDIVLFRFPRSDFVQWLGLIEIESFDGDPYYWDNRKLESFKCIPSGQVVLMGKAIRGDIKKIAHEKKFNILLLDDYKDSKKPLFEVIESNLEKLYSKLEREVSL